MATALAKGRAAFEREAWADASAYLSAADTEAPLAPEDLDRLATAAQLIGHDRESTEARTRAHSGFLERGDRRRAVRSAYWLALAMIDKPALQAQAGGWLSRARRLLEEQGETCAEHGLLLCASGFQKVVAGDVAAALDAFRQGVEIGTRFGDRDVITLGRHGEGRCLIRMNRRAEGIALLDEIMVAVTRGEVAPLITGIVYCSVISACDDLFDWRRAQEWTTALARWCTAHPDMVPFRGDCLVRRSQVMQRTGAWKDALVEALRAADLLAGPPTPFVDGVTHYQLAELYRLSGNFGKAEDEYRLASQAGRDPLPGLALLRLRQNQTTAAAAAIQRALRETTNALRLPPLMVAGVEILLAAGDIAAARAAALELTRIAAESDAAFLKATSAQATGAVALAAGDLAGALAALRDAWTLWQDLAAPYDQARVRSLLGLTYRQMGDHDGAQLEFEAAQETFERLGAEPDIERITQLLAPTASPAARSAASGLTGRELEVLRLIATGATNRAIGADLAISEKTVARHISNIFTKLDLSSRAAATAYAYERKLV